MKNKFKFLAMMLIGILLSVNVWGEEFTLVTDASQLSDGDKIIIVGYANETYGYYALGAQNTAKDGTLTNRGAVSIPSPDANVITLTSQTPCVITLEANSTNWKLKSDCDNGDYLAATGSKLSDPKNYLAHIAEPSDDISVFTISIDTDNKASIVASGISARNTLRYNITFTSGGDINTNLFSCYSSGQKDVYIYRCTSCTACTTDLTPPVVTATAGNGSATLTWGAVDHATSYTVTCAGATIGSITGEGTKTCTLTGLTNDVTYTWKVKAIGGDIYCDSEEATGNVTPSANHTVAWYVDGEVYTEGSPTTEVADGGTVTELPTPPAGPNACAGSAFVGWTDQTINNSTDTKPDVLFKDAEHAPEVNENVIYHAVFAEPE